MDERDAARYVPGPGEKAAIAEILAGDRASLLFVHGPGGIGKSTLLREIARRGTEAGRDVHLADGRAYASDPGALAAVLEDAATATHPLLLIDAYEWVASIGGTLRARILPMLSTTGRAVIACRRPPEPEWWTHGWDAVMTTLSLSRFDEERGRALMARHGVLDADHQNALLEWADGLPLALAVGADATRSAADVNLASPNIDDALADALLLRVTGGLTDVQREILEVASVAPMIDARLLAAALPDVDAEAGERWLRDLSFAEFTGSRVRIHERLAEATRRRLVALDPGREREVRRRVADELTRRALQGHPEMVAEIINLVDDPAIQAAFGWGAARRTQVDGPRDDDTAALEAHIGGAGWWPGIRRFLEEAPDCVHIARDASGEIVGLAIVTTPGRAPTWIDEDVILGPWIADARNRAAGGDVLFFRSTVDLTEGGDPSVLSALNLAALQRSGLTNLRWIYGHAVADDLEAQELSAALGAVVVPELEVRDGGRTIQCHIIDHGPGGIVAAARALVYADLGLPAPGVIAAPVGSVDVEDVRLILRAFHDPVALADLPQAAGPSISARADGLRAWITEGVEAAFGPSPDERLLHDAIVLRYLTPDGTHQRTAHDLHLSRSTYFRRLSDALQRLTRYLTDPSGDTEPA